jgi:hypothetical protein
LMHAGSKTLMLPSRAGTIEKDESDGMSKSICGRGSLIHLWGHRSICGKGSVDVILTLH